MPMLYMYLPSPYVKLYSYSSSDLFSSHPLMKQLLQQGVIYTQRVVMGKV